MVETRPATPQPSKGPSGPKVSGTRTIVSLVFLVIVLVVCAIELRAGLGQFLTLRSYNKVSENNLFKELELQEAQGMLAAFPSKHDVVVGEYEDEHHYYWVSLLRPLMGDKSPELYLSSDHRTPARAVSFFTSKEGEIDAPKFDPNAPVSTSPPGPPMGMGMGGPPGGGRQKDGNKSRPPLEDSSTDPKSDESSNADSEKTKDQPESTSPDSAATESDVTPEPPADNEKSEDEPK